MFLVIILTAYYFYFFWFEHSFNICIGWPKCSTGRGEATAWLGIFLRHTFGCLLNFSLLERGVVGGRSLILSLLLSSPLEPPPRAAHLPQGILKLLERKLPGQWQLRLRKQLQDSQDGQNIFSFFLPGSVSLVNAFAAPTTLTSLHPPSPREKI